MILLVTTDVHDAGNPVEPSMRLFESPIGPYGDTRAYDYPEFLTRIGSGILYLFVS